MPGAASNGCGGEAGVQGRAEEKKEEEKVGKHSAQGPRAYMGRSGRGGMHGVFYWGVGGGGGGEGERAKNAVCWAKNDVCGDGRRAVKCFCFTSPWLTSPGGGGGCLSSCLASHPRTPQPASSHGDGGATTANPAGDGAASFRLSDGGEGGGKGGKGGGGRLREVREYVESTVARHKFSKKKNSIVNFCGNSTDGDSVYCSFPRHTYIRLLLFSETYRAISDMHEKVASLDMRRRIHAKSTDDDSLLLFICLLLLLVNSCNINPPPPPPHI
jgi:hypothetical protein